LSHFRAFFVTSCEQRKNATQDLLHFITVRTATASGHKPYQKYYQWAGKIPSKNPKKLTGEANSAGSILYGDVEKVKKFMGHFVKVETIVHLCPLLSQRELFYFINLGESAN